jgi:hypothetical protein
MLRFNPFASLSGQVGCIALLVLATLSAAIAYPKPAVVPYRWELDFDAGPLRLYADPVTGASYWYFTYVVTNRTSDDQIWAPSFVLYTDQGEILSSGEDVPSVVEESIREMIGNPLLEMQNEVIGDLYQGREHAKDGLVVWQAPSTDVNELSLFVSGISGETARVENPISGEELILRKTLQRNYLIRGDAAARGSDPGGMVDDRWVLR